MQAIQVRKSASAGRELVLAIVLLLGFVLLALAVISGPRSNAGASHSGTTVVAASAPSSGDQGNANESRTTHGFLP